MSFPVITGFGVFFRIVDMQHEQAICAVKNNEAHGYIVTFPDGNSPGGLGEGTATVVKSRGFGHISTHSYELIYTPAGPTYELKEDGISLGTISAANRQAWAIVIGNGTIQTNIGSWTNIKVDSVTVTTLSFETFTAPSWAGTTFLVGAETWGYLPWLNSMQMGFHERNNLSQCVLTLPQFGYIDGVGYEDNWFAGFRWSNREVQIETRQGNGQNWTTWKTAFIGMCDEPHVVEDQAGSYLEITARDKWPRRLQMYHGVRGYSDGEVIDGVIQGKTWTEIIVDQIATAGLASTVYNVLSSPLRPRTRQQMGEATLDFISSLCDEGVVAMYTNRSAANFGRIEVQEFDWGSDTPDYTITLAEALSIDWTDSLFGMTAQVIVTVSHSEFGEFTDMYPRVPIPPIGATIRKTAAIAQTATDINETRLLPFLAWRVANRELNAVTVRLMGQDWFEIGMEIAVADSLVLGIQGEFYVVIGADYSWTPDGGFITTLYLANQHPEKSIMKALLTASINISYPMGSLRGTLTMTGAISTVIIP
jgi:hypothetical protein